MGNSNDYFDSSIYGNICRILHCEPADVEDISPVSEGLNNDSFKFRVNGEYYIYRHPGINASGVIDRKKEAKALRVAKELGIDETLIFIDEDEGWKISAFIRTTEPFSFANERHVAMLAEKLRILHDSKIQVGSKFDYAAEAEKILEILKDTDPEAYEECLEDRKAMQPVFDYLAGDRWQVSLCHNDIYEPNILVAGDDLHLIDWEFARDCDIGFDICKLFAVLDPPFDAIGKWAAPYFGRVPYKNEITHLVACAAIIYYYWYIWGIYAGRNSEGVAEYMDAWCGKMHRFTNMTLALINELKQVS